MPAQGVGHRVRVLVARHALQDHGAHHLAPALVHPCRPMRGQEALGPALLEAVGQPRPSSRGSGSGAPRWAGVTIVRGRTRSGWARATATAVAEPIDWPTSAARSMPEVVEHRDRVGGEDLVAVGRGRVGGGGDAVAAGVVGHHAVAGALERPRAVHHVAARGGQAVEQQDRRRPRPRPRRGASRPRASTSKGSGGPAGQRSGGDPERGGAAPGSRARRQSSSGRPSSGASQISSPSGSGVPQSWQGCVVMRGQDDGGPGRIRMCCDGPVEPRIPCPQTDRSPRPRSGHPVPHLLGRRRTRARSWPPRSPAIRPRARVAWVERATAPCVARVACPPGRPSRWRPVVAAVVTLEMAPAAEDRVLVARAAPEARAIRPDAGRRGRPARRSPSARRASCSCACPPRRAVIAVDALDAVGRADRPPGARRGLRAALRRVVASAGGWARRTAWAPASATGAGRPGLADAAFEVGYDAVAARRGSPPGLRRGRPRVEPDVSYPSAPAGAGPRLDRRRRRRACCCARPRRRSRARTPAAATRGRSRWASAPGVLRGRGLVTLVWETPERAFGLQVRGVGRGGGGRPARRPVDLRRARPA